MTGRRYIRLAILYAYDQIKRVCVKYTPIAFFLLSFLAFYLLYSNVVDTDKTAKLNSFDKGRLNLIFASLCVAFYTWFLTRVYDGVASRRQHTINVLLSHTQSESTAKYKRKFVSRFGDRQLRESDWEYIDRMTRPEFDNLRDHSLDDLKGEKRLKCKKHNVDNYRDNHEIRSVLKHESGAEIKAHNSNIKKNRVIIHALLNEYEFISAGILSGDLDEHLMRKCIRGNLTKLVNQCLPYIRHLRGEKIEGSPRKPLLYENLLRVHERWVIYSTP